MVFYVKKVLDFDEKLSGLKMYWNDFVLGNIVFWNKDKEKLRKYIVNIEKG